MNFNFLKDWHTWVVVAAFVSAGLTAIVPMLPADIAMPVSGILSVLAIIINQKQK